MRIRSTSATQPRSPGSSTGGALAATVNGALARLADLPARLPARRLGRPEDIANAIAFLMTDSFVTGTVLPAEGAQVLV